jgi:hypothetical protein
MIARIWSGSVRTGDADEYATERIGREVLPLISRVPARG